MANWSSITRQGNVIDRRGMSAGGLGLFGVIAVMGISLLFGVDPMQLMGQLEQQGALDSTTTQEQPPEFQGADTYETFSRQVLGSLDGYWEQHAQNYQPAALVLFRDRTSSGCGGAMSMVGPHYCPLDQQIYLDERFFDQLQAEFGAQGGDVAEAYVIAHEVGHHVQNLLGLIPENRTAEASVQVELTADCMAGAWLGSLQSKGIFEEGEVREALSAASAVGDDNIQQRTQGTVQPETWTHGSSAEREESVMLGFRNANDPSVCLEGTNA